MGSLYFRKKNSTYVKSERTLAFFKGAESRWFLQRGLLVKTVMKRTSNSFKLLTAVCSCLNISQNDSEEI